MEQNIEELRKKYPKVCRNCSFACPKNRECKEYSCQTKKSVLFGKRIEDPSHYVCEHFTNEHLYPKEDIKEESK